MYIIAHFLSKFFNFRSSEEDERHKIGEEGEGGQEAKIEGVDEKQ